MPLSTHALFNWSKPGVTHDNIYAQENQEEEEGKIALSPPLATLKHVPKGPLTPGMYTTVKTDGPQEGMNWQMGENASRSWRISPFRILVCFAFDPSVKLRPATARSEVQQAI